MNNDVAVGVVAQIGDLSALFGLSGRIYAGLSFLVVLASGGVLLVTRDEFVERAVDRVVGKLRRNGAEVEVRHPEGQGAGLMDAMAAYDDPRASASQH